MSRFGRISQRRSGIFPSNVSIWCCEAAARLVPTKPPASGARAAPLTEQVIFAVAEDDSLQWARRGLQGFGKIRYAKSHQEHCYLSSFARQLRFLVRAEI
jgi:hypothetical protein